MTLAEIKTEVDRRATLIGATGHPSLPTYGRTEDGARPHIEANSRVYSLVVIERGQELSRLETQDLEELLYHIFEKVTHGLAWDYERAHRVETQDNRRIAYRKQVELLTQISGDWGRRQAQKHELTLRQHPLDDKMFARMSLSQQIGWAKACEQFPLPKMSDETGQKT